MSSWANVSNGADSSTGMSTGHHAANDDRWPSCRVRAAVLTDSKHGRTQLLSNSLAINMTSRSVVEDIWQRIHAWIAHLDEDLSSLVLRSGQRSMSEYR